MSEAENFFFEHNLSFLNSIENNSLDSFSGNYFSEIFPNELPFLANLKNEEKEIIEIRIKNEGEDKDKTNSTKKNNLGRKRKEGTQKIENKKIHGRLGIDNMKHKINNHFISFILDYTNYILPFLGNNKCFYKLYYKDKIKNSISSLKEKNIGEILKNNVSTSYTKVSCNENLNTYNEIKDEPGVKALFSENCIELFVNIYYKNKRYINLSNYGINANIYLPNKEIKMFEDLLQKVNIKDDINKISKNINNEEYIEKLKKIVEKYYLK